MAGTVPPQRSRPPRPQQRKRKWKPPVEEGAATKPTGETPAGDKAARKRQKKKRNATDADDGDMDFDLSINRAVARMDSNLLANYVARQTLRFGKDLSPVELADLTLDAKPILDTSSYDKDRTVDNLPHFLETFCDGGQKHLSQASKDKGAPHTIIVTGAGIRAVDLVRAVRSFQTANSTVSKLFAKHIKLAEAVSFLQSHRTGIAVGTPARLIDLLDSGALSLTHLKRIVVDASHIDQKKRGVLDMQDTALPVVRWLARPELRARYGGNEEDTPTDSKDDKAAQPLSILFY
ncbi:hypothetical protein CMQ_4633 [Grosmannia clavigera kw1407]|uniref:Protein CMS1 n=1 Tax=Grosmannia clavigera (strain kw1407 / UAMH 11150) TaxID=655863 RepID=F0XUM2_GROCL|nr:uncharacterized protein CMQ_4633 [Grosmannia clavigera kw1407]EFW98781.1 hypothetical protein CMQ_4633 [Grosmannia clavigera kw1407]